VKFSKCTCNCHAGVLRAGVPGAPAHPPLMIPTNVIVELNVCTFHYTMLHNSMQGLPGGCVEQGVGVGVELSSGSSFTANTHTKNTKSEFKDKKNVKSWL
jgi:hypothetical protein